MQQLNNYIFILIVEIVDNDKKIDKNNIYLFSS